MSNIRNALFGICLATISLGVLAQTADEHKDHHPASTAAAASTPSQEKAPAKGMSSEKSAHMEQHMKAMHAMREKMAAAKTPEERQALMAEHMKLMQDGMAMMRKMGDGGQADKGMANNMAERQQMMEKRMEMMESMMQMMVDRMGMSGPGR